MKETSSSQWVWMSILAVALFLPVHVCVVKACESSRYASPHSYSRRNDLRQIGFGLIQYIDQFGEGRWFPPSLWSLYPGIFSDPAILTDAADLGSETDREDAWLGRYHYLLEGGALANIPSSAPMVINPYLAGDEARFMVLFADAHVETLSESRFLEVWQGWQERRESR